MARWSTVFGAKGAGLADMARLGLPVPPGFTIATAVCVALARDGDFPSGLREASRDALRKVEAETGLVFGDPDRPLLLAVRAGARVAMPRMTDTVLNVGLNATTVEGLAARPASASRSIPIAASSRCTPRP